MHLANHKILQELSFCILQEFAKHDAQPEKYIKQYTGENPKTGQSFTCDIGYERFLGAEIFFQPDMYSQKFSIPLPQVISDTCIRPSDLPEGLEQPL